MKRKVKNLMFAVVILFLLLFVSCALYEQAPEQSPLVWQVNVGFCIVLSALVALVCLVAMVIISRRPPEAGDFEPTSTEVKRYIARGVLLTLLALCIGAGLMILGRYLIPVGGAMFCRVVFCTCAGLWLLLFVISRIGQRRYVKRLGAMSVRETQTFLLSHRDAAEKTAAEKSALLMKIIRATDATAVAVGLLGALSAFAFGGTGWSFGYAPAALLSGAMILTSFGRIRFPVSKVVFAEDVTHVRREEYPILYANAWKAMHAVGVDKNLHLSIIPTFTASIASYNDTLSLQIGAKLIGLLSEEELYHILLHEFHHTSDENRERLRIGDYGFYVDRGTCFVLTDWLDRLFLWSDTVYLLEQGLYRYADTLSAEAAADHAAVTCGDPAVAASALLKTVYYRFFEWEKDSRDHTPDFAPETPERPFMQNDLDAFHALLTVREPFWRELYEKEILARNASHPTVRMRIEALGVTDPVCMPAHWSEAYAAEVERALKAGDKLLVDSVRDVYAERRKDVYLEPLEHIRAWEAAGKPLVAAEYPDIVDDLRNIGRVDDAMALCDRAISELSEYETCNACYVKGTCLLHRFDASGVELIYRALENNSNYIEEGLGTLGEYFCMNGMEKELNEYRERALAKAEEQQEKFDKIGELTPDDRFETEQLPEGRLDEALAYIEQVADGHIAAVYLVRKVITDDFFCSPFIIRFKPGTTYEDRGTVLHKIFRFLDSTPYDWQFSLFDADDYPKVMPRIERVAHSLVLKLDG